MLSGKSKFIPRSKSGRGDKFAGCTLPLSAVAELDQYCRSSGLLIPLKRRRGGEVRGYRSGFQYSGRDVRETFFFNHAESLPNR